MSVNLSEEDTVSLLRQMLDDQSIPSSSNLVDLPEYTLESLAEYGRILEQTAEDYHQINHDPSKLMPSQAPQQVDHNPSSIMLNEAIAVFDLEGFQETKPLIHGPGPGPETQFLSKGPGTHLESQGPGKQFLSQGIGTQLEIQVPRIQLLIQSPGTQLESQGPGTHFLSQGSRTQLESQDPGTQFLSQGPETQFLSQGPGTQFLSQEPGTQFLSQEPGTQLESQGPGTIGSGHKKRHAEDNVSCYKIKNKTKKQKVYEVAGPLEDNEAERKRLNAKKAKDYRDRQKAEKENLQQENEDMKKQINQFQQIITEKERKDNKQQQQIEDMKKQITQLQQIIIKERENKKQELLMAAHKNEARAEVGKLALDNPHKHEITQQQRMEEMVMKGNNLLKNMHMENTQLKHQTETVSADRDMMEKEIKQSNQVENMATVMDRLLLDQCLSFVTEQIDRQTQLRDNDELQYAGPWKHS